jgi:dTDP-4-amino-4,6-dideoxygalactose transaminase
MDRIYLSSPHMSGHEMKYVTEAFEQNWVAPLGPNVDAFEETLAQYCGIKHVAALSSGTAAIHLALVIMGIKQGDEVIASTFTFSATINPIVYQGATPIFIDSEPETWNMDPDLLEETIKDRIAHGAREKLKAIIVVHLYGMPSNMDRIMYVANKYGIPVIEDAAEALGSKYRGKQVGTFGEMGILSFNGNKIITTSGGGALISDDNAKIEQARFLATQARDKAPHYQHSQIGYNYRLSNVLAGIGRGQMEVLDQRVSQRRDNFNFYKASLGVLPGVKFMDEPEDSYFSNRWLTTILVDPEKAGVSREEIQSKLQEENIETRPLWKPMHQQPVFSKYPVYLKGISDELFRMGLCLPSGSNLTRENRSRIISHLIDAMKK